MKSRCTSVPYVFLLALKQYSAATSHEPHLRRRQSTIGMTSPPDDIEMAPPNWEDQEVECHHSAKYHTHMTRQSTCTNDNVYPPPWDNPPMSDRFFFTAAPDCCEFYFPKAKCVVINVCDGDGVPEELEPVEATPKPVAVPTMQPTSKPTKSAGDIPTLHANDNCHPLKKWHADTRLGKTEAGCTNNDVYPPGWDNPPLNESMFFDDPSECCQFFFPGNANCDWVNVCAAIALTSTSTTTTTISTTTVNLPQYTYSEDNPCHNRKWHVDAEDPHLSGCINDLMYPASWNNGIMDGVTLFTTPKACCDKVLDLSFGDDGECTIKEAEECIVETESPTTGGGDDACSSKWHPDEDFKGCTNSPSGTYPSSWDETEMASKYMHDTYASCCDSFFKSKECVKTDLCNPDDCSASKWHPSRDFTTCSNSNDYPSEWETVPTNKARYIHDTYEECCSSAAFAGKPCPKEDICNPISCEDQFWHPDTMFKRCTNSLGDHPPEWTTDTYLYGGYEACCSSVFPGRACPKEDVCNPTACEDQLWHPTTDWKKCSNSVEFPSEWTTDNYLHSSADSCCEAVFPGKSCRKEDVCNPITCSEQLWHPTTDFKTCTNDLSYPDAWNEGTGYDTYMHKSSADCCNAMFFGRHCPKNDVCPETPCSEQYWHPTTDWKKCSNSLQFPSVWTTDNYLHSSVDSCCGAIFPEMPCPLEDVCPDGKGSTIHVPEEEASCQDQKWHPSTDFKMCTNSKDHPPSWSTPPGSDTYMHDSVEACCASIFFGRDCPTIDVCESAAMIHMPTQSPTSKPLNSSGSSTTTTSTSFTSESPTLFPTYTFPTTSPILCVTAKWHPGDDGTCSNSPVYNALWDMPALSSTYLHNTHRACCRVFYKKKNCGKVDVCAEPATVTTAKPSHVPTSEGVIDDTNICKMKKYHPMSVFTRKCINDNNFPPLWSSMTSTYFFSDAQDCCDSFYDDGWGACEVEDICSSADRIPDNVHNCGKKWHPISEANRICSNGDRYPPVWDSDPDRFLFGTAEECCEAFYSEGTGQCEIVNTC